MAALGPSRGALLPPLVPALGVFWAWLLLGEQVSALQVAGMATVIAGMLLGALWRGRGRVTAARHGSGWWQTASMLWPSGGR